jgi:hypothetical protein
MAVTDADLEALRAHIEQQALKQGVNPVHATRRFSAFAAYVQEAADKLALPPDHDHCRHYASLRLEQDALLERQLTGKETNTGDLLRIGDALKDVLATAKPVVPPSVSIEFCDGPTTCPACGWRSPAAPYVKPDEDYVTIDADPTDVTPNKPVPVEVKALPAPSPAPDVERPHPPGIRDQPRARMRVHHESWRGHVGAIDNP